MPDGMAYGDVLEQPEEDYEQGDVASAIFVAGNPRNNLRVNNQYTSCKIIITDVTVPTLFSLPLNVIVQTICNICVCNIV